MTTFDIPVLTGVRPSAPAWEIHRADGADLVAHRRLRHEAFVTEQGLFAGTDADAADEDPRTIVLVADAGDEGGILGGVRLSPACSPDLGWWTGSRLVVAPGARGSARLGEALVREACRVAEEHGVLRFDAAVQDRYTSLFTRLGWTDVGAAVDVGGVPHRRMTWPIERIRRLAESTKSALRDVLDPGGAAWRASPAASLGGDGFLGDDGAPVPGTDLVVACDAILPAMVAADPEWAGWCSVLVNVNDLSAMGAAPLGLMDAVGGPDAATVRRVVNGLRSAAEAWDVALLGGHTQLGVPASLAVTALGRAAAPIPGGGGAAGDALSLTVDTSGCWRPGSGRRQWDSTSQRTGAELRSLGALVAQARPAAAKDVSMAGIVGTAGMLAEASGCGVEIDLAAVPRPDDVAMGDWLTCFPGFGMLTADAPGASRMATPLARTAAVGRLGEGRGVRLRWPDGETTTAIDGPVTGLGPARRARS